MSIDVKCNSCGSTYSVTDKLAGGSVRCVKCKAPIHVPIVRQKPAPVRAATAAEAAGEAELSFDYAPASSPAAVAVSAAPAAVVAPPPLPPSPSDMNLVASVPVAEPASEPKAMAAPRSRPASTGGLKSRLKALGTSDFDFRFRSYFSGALGRGLWILSICAALYLGYTAVRALFDAAQLPGEFRRTAEWMACTQLFFIVAGLALLRIALETVSALFNIAKTLRELRDELRNRAQTP